MSRIGYKPVAVPSDVTVSVDGSTVTVKGPKGELTREFNPLIKIAQNEENEYTFEPVNQSKEARSMHGTSRSLFYNMVLGTHEGFSKQLAYDYPDCYLTKGEIGCALSHMAIYKN